MGLEDIEQKHLTWDDLPGAVGKKVSVAKITTMTTEAGTVWVPMPHMPRTVGTLERHDAENYFIDNTSEIIELETDIGCGMLYGPARVFIHIEPTTLEARDIRLEE